MGERLSQLPCGQNGTCRRTEMQFWVVNKLTAKRFGWTCHKGRGCCYGLALWLFSNDFTSRWTSTLLLAMAMTFSPHTDNIKLTLVHSNRRWRKRGMNMIRRRWHLPFAGFLCWKSNQRKLSLSFSSAYFGYGFEIIFFCRLHASYFVAELKIVYVANITVL